MDKEVEIHVDEPRCPDCGSVGYWEKEWVDIGKAYVWHCYGCGSFWSEKEIRDSRPSETK